MREYVIKAGEDQALSFKKLKKLMEMPPQVDRNRTPPPCRLCPCFQPKFRFRRCLYAVCPYGKKPSSVYRRKPLRCEKILPGGGDMRV